MSQCSRCLLDLGIHAPLNGGFCPNCGTKSEAAESSQLPEVKVGDLHGAAPVGPGASFVLFSRFWQSVREIVFTPTQFFSTNASMLASRDSLSTALAFAVIIQWLASFFNFLWRTIVGTALESRMDDFFRIAGDVMQNSPGTAESLSQLRSRTIEFMFGAGAIVLTPFTTLLKLFVSALLVHAAVRFFMKDSPDRPHSYSTTLKILAYATGPWILCVIPGVGILLAYVLGFGAAVIGIREVYRTTTGRAVLAVLFPELLLMAFIIGIGVFFLFLAFNVLRLVF